MYNNGLHILSFIQTNTVIQNRFIYLRIFQHTQGSYPRPSINSLWSNSFHLGFWGCLGYVPGVVCWNFLRNIATLFLIVILEVIRTHSANGPWKKSLNFIFPTKYVIPKSLSRLAIGQVRGFTIVNLHHPVSSIQTPPLQIHTPIHSKGGILLFFRAPGPTRYLAECCTYTPPRTNMEPENTPLEKEKHLQTTNFWVPCKISGVYSLWEICAWVGGAKHMATICKLWNYNSYILYTWMSLEISKWLANWL